MSEIERLQEFFFEAAIDTYAGNGQKTTIPEIPRSKVLRYERGELLYVDTYFTNGDYSGGQTVIWNHGIPAWLMQYNGYCKNDDKVVLDFLKTVLLTAYRSKIFRGGRGPSDYRAGVLTYRNVPKGEFHQFSGHEWIDESVRFGTIFLHRYQGLLLDATLLERD